MIRITFLADSAAVVAGVDGVDDVVPHPDNVRMNWAMTTSETTHLILLILFSIKTLLLCGIWF
jgi:hypothetical protein